MLYPSITICKKYSIEATLDFNTNETNITKFLTEIHKHTWKLDDQFYFFTHPGALNMSFPCTTGLGGRTPGKPCVFPINYFGIKHEKCFIFDTTIPACITKIGPRKEIFSYDQADLFGYCGSDCNGESLSQDSPYNLAQSKHKDLWVSNFYDLSSYENGYCHTYNPPIKSPPDFTNRLYFMMNNIPSNYKDYDIFLHEKGQFWPRSDMFTFGQSNAINLDENIEMEIIFSVKEIFNMNRANRPCEQSPNYSFTKCLQKFAKSETNCQVDLNEFDQDQDQNCTKENFLHYFDLLIQLKQIPISSLIKRSGCLQKCKTIQYPVETRLQKSNWTSNWTAEVYVQPKSNLVEHSTEYLFYDINDLLSSFGGNLGLFLGWSILSVLEGASFILCLCRHKCNDKSSSLPA